ncbi:hypothetical protein QQS21_010096 [Conoideocrella luteorostrata]|uniref:Uncharacterized protein n=1 Tax=Conoideocrella luteorostrata TaxID=1105319 RepID=A0AAJ0CFQ4_9HYPO|nr:hypothetical protein QQS21_010096 [Conoideocrella luteorostrata]
MKDFYNRGLQNVKGKWVSKSGNLFEGLPTSNLQEIDLTTVSKDRGKYRVIVTKNKMFIGITEHVEADNVRSLYDVNEKAKAGEFLNGGSLPESIKTTNSLSVSRKQIAEAMDGKVRGSKVGDGWAREIKELDGSLSKNIRVVYKGNTFIRLEDFSNEDNIRPVYTPPPCKRDGTPCPYHISDSTEEITNDNRPGEVSAGSEELGVAETPNNNRPGEVGASPEELDVAKTAEEVSEMEFAAFARAFGLDAIPKKWKMKFSEVRPKLLGYKPLMPKSPNLRAGSGGVAGAKLFGAVGVAAWVNGVIQAFRQDASALDRAAAITAIIPFVGCAVGRAAKDKNNENSVINSIDEALCYLGDGLLLGGFAPAAVVVGFARVIIQSFKPPPELPKEEEIQRARDESWKDFISEQVFTFIYSHENLYPEGRNGSFAPMLESALKIESLAVISRIAQEIGALNASSRISSPNLDQKQLQISAQNATEKVREEALAEVVKRQQNTLLGLPFSLRDNFEASLSASAREYNSKFIKEITSSAMIKKHSPSELVSDIAIGETALVGPADHKEIKYGEAKRRMEKISEFLQKQPLPMPSLFEVAFVLGQSKGMKITPRTLSIQDFLKQRVAPISNSLASAITITHATSVVRLLQGEIKEDQLPTTYPLLNNDIRHQLNILLSIKLGKIYEDAKVANADKLNGRFLSPTERDSLVRPLVPPIVTKPNTTVLVGLLIGLSNTIAEAKLNESSHELPEKQREDVNKKSNIFQTLVNRPQGPETILKLQFESDATSRAENSTNSTSLKAIMTRDKDPRRELNLGSRNETKTTNSDGELLLAALTYAEKQTQRMRDMVARKLG